MQIFILIFLKDGFSHGADTCVHCPTRVSTNPGGVSRYRDGTTVIIGTAKDRTHDLRGVSSAFCNCANQA